jgi:hypothetical protein
MSYLAFDMDGTIGSFTILRRMLCIFNQPTFFIKTPTKIPPPNEKLDTILSVSYSNFVRRILENELSAKPLGLFRPGIFALFKRIAVLRKAGLVKGVIIYSNNQTEGLVTFVKDVINLAVEAVIDESFFRFSMKRLAINARVGNPEKTWREIKQLLASIGASPEIEPKSVIFLDDLVHKDLKANLGHNYINVEEYIHNPPVIDVLEVYRKALVDDNKEMEVNLKSILGYIKSCTHDLEQESVDKYLTAILAEKAKGEYATKGTGPIPANDKKASKYMLASLNSIIGRVGGSRRTRKKTNL